MTMIDTKLITHNLQEIVGEEELQEKSKHLPFNIYHGTATTGKPNLGYLVTALKIADFLKAGASVTFLFADMHAYLDNKKTNWEQLDYRVKYYQIIMSEIIKTAGADLTKIKFVKGSDFQLSSKYTLDMYKLSALVTTKDTQKAGAEVVKQTKNPAMSAILYPILQALDEEYLQADAQFGGMDQRKIFMFARENLPKIGYKKRIHLLGKLLPGLGQTGKMSSSEPNSKIDFDDTDKQIKKKINKAYCVDGDSENVLMHICELILFPIKKNMLVERPQEYGGNVNYETLESIKIDFENKRLSSIDLKQTVAKYLIEIISPIRTVLEANKDLAEKAYPKK